MQQLLKNEYLYLTDLFRFRASLRVKPRGWYWSYFIVLLLVYLPIDIISTLLFGISLYTLFSSYFELYEDPEFDYLFFFMVILAPLIEELLFRLPMLYKQDRLKCWLFLVSLILFSVHWIVGLIALVLTIYLLTKDLDKLSSFNVKKWHERNAKSIFWVLTLAFALVHVTNYNVNELPIYAYPIVVVTQMTGGILLGIVRIRFGLRYAILNHALFNLFAYLIEPS